VVPQFVTFTGNAKRARGWHGHSYEPKWQPAWQPARTTPAAPAKTAAHASRCVSDVNHASLVRHLELHMHVSGFNQKKMAALLCLPSPAKLSRWMGRGEHQLPSAAAAAAIDTVVATYLDSLS
jgi:hypothetical protein